MKTRRFPEGIAIRGKNVYVSGPARFGIFTPSVVLAYNRRTGRLVGTFPITLQDPDPTVMKGLDDQQRRILVANRASMIVPPNPALFSIFDVFVDETGRPVP